jgi:hypothetical protein
MGPDKGRKPSGCPPPNILEKSEFRKEENLPNINAEKGAHGSWLRHYATSQMVAGSIPDEVIRIFFFNLPNPSSRTMAPGSTQPLTEMSTRNLLGCKGRLARKADSLTAICESII